MPRKKPVAVFPSFGKRAENVARYIEALRVRHRANLIGLFLTAPPGVPGSPLTPKQLKSRGYAAIRCLQKLGLVFHNEPNWYLFADWRERLKSTKYKKLVGG